MEYEPLLQLGFRGYEELAESTINEFKKLDLDTHGQAPADEGFLTVWDEFKDQVQNSESFFFDAYELTIKQFIRKELSKLIAWELAVLWSVTDHSLSFDWEDNSLTYEEICDAVEPEIYDRIFECAKHEEIEYQEGFVPRTEDEFEDEAEEVEEDPQPEQLELF